MRYGRWLLLVLVLACQSRSATEPRSEPTPALPDKARLYGDPGLLPTREGERARREVARAGEIERAVRLLPGVEEVRVDVELEQDGSLRAAAVVARAQAGTRGDIEPATRRIVEVVLGPDAPAATTVLVAELPPVPEDLEPGLPIVPLALALLGLGVSAGIALERSRRMLGRRRSRRRR